MNRLHVRITTCLRSAFRLNTLSACKHWSPVPAQSTYALDLARWRRVGVVVEVCIIVMQCHAAMHLWIAMARSGRVWHACLLSGMSGMHMTHYTYEVVHLRIYSNYMPEYSLDKHTYWPMCATTTISVTTIELIRFDSIAKNRTCLSKSTTRML